MFTPVALCVRAEDLAGCRTDGFDVATWVREGLVDILILGNRTTTVDVAAFRQLLAANPGPVPVTLCPMFDRHHTTDGYYDPPHGFHSAVFANFWAQGADFVTVFNWPTAPEEEYTRLGSVGDVIAGTYEQHTEAMSAPVPSLGATAGLRC